MSYQYTTERNAIFTDDGQREFTRGRDKVLAAVRATGAITMGKAMNMFRLGNTWAMMACVDRMVELGDLTEVATDKQHVAQYRVFLGKLTDR